MSGRDIRMGRLFGAEGKAVVVACDHGMFDGPHKGMADIPRMLAGLGDGADGILLSPGVLPHARGYFGRRGRRSPSPGLITTACSPSGGITGRGSFPIW